MAASKVRHAYVTRKATATNTNSAIVNGTLCFIEEDRSIALKMNDTLKEFGKTPVINKTDAKPITYLDSVHIVNNLGQLPPDPNIQRIMFNDRSLTLVLRVRRQ